MQGGFIGADGVRLFLTHLSHLTPLLDMEEERFNGFLGIMLEY
jgi:hypothetical protein